MLVQKNPGSRVTKPWRNRGGLPFLVPYFKKLEQCALSATLSNLIGLNGAMIGKQPEAMIAARPLRRFLLQCNM
ncbi:MAG: hypothetical protein AAGL24_07085 [Pseudomonadota bacterium]